MIAVALHIHDFRGRLVPSSVASHRVFTAPGATGAAASLSPPQIPVAASFLRISIRRADPRRAVAAPNATPRRGGGLTEHRRHPRSAGGYAHGA